MSDQTNAEVSDERLPWRCVKCDCREFARMDTRHWDGGPWEPGDFVRCVHCKETSYWPRELDRRSVTSQASEGAEPVAYQWRYYHPEEEPSEWRVRQQIIRPAEAGEKTRGIEVRPLYASPVSKRVERLETALTELEAANDALTATRSTATYLSMTDNDKATPALERLDAARKSARQALGGRS